MSRLHHDGCALVVCSEPRAGPLAFVLRKNLPEGDPVSRAGGSIRAIAPTLTRRDPSPWPLRRSATACSKGHRRRRASAAPRGRRRIRGRLRSVARWTDMDSYAGSRRALPSCAHGCQCQRRCRLLGGAGSRAGRCLRCRGPSDPMCCCQEQSDSVATHRCRPCGCSRARTCSCCCCRHLLQSLWRRQPSAPAARPHSEGLQARPRTNV